MHRAEEIKKKKNERASKSVFTLVGEQTELKPLQQVHTVLVERHSQTERIFLPMPSPILHVADCALAQK